MNDLSHCYFYVFMHTVCTLLFTLFNTLASVHVLCATPITLNLINLIKNSITVFITNLKKTPPSSAKFQGEKPDVLEKSNIWPTGAKICQNLSYTAG